ncbi:TonB-dependent receptor [Membranihabitans maritimus]|uniref:TonB-dependent receptor n=1 Tax=Membranihabitans maritimus TaxID=2904244 RepID=UPI001F39BE33|nr:TonB-dependent receptor [Membranihabitans maritimus]
MRLIIFTILASICIFNSILAQSGSITGIVKDENNNHLMAATVLVLENNIGTTTDENGKYSINSIDEGTYTLRVSYLGYEPVEVTVDIISGKETQQDIALESADNTLQAVEIIGRRARTYKNAVSFAGTKTATLIKDIPQAISYVTKEIFADQQAYRIGDIVKNISGVNMFSGYDDFTFRGFRSGSSDSKMINGLRTVGIFGPQPILTNMERVEVIKGPASALFANTQPGGTMNYVTKKPLDESRKAISFTVGSFNTLRATADFTGRMNEDGSLLYRVNLGYEDGDSHRDLQKNKTFMIAPSVSFIPTKNTRINFDLVISQYKGKLDRGQPIFGATSGTDLTSTPPSFAIGEANDYHTNNVQYFTLSLNHQFSSRLSFNSSYMRFTWDEDLFEHRTSNSFALDSAGTQIPTLMGMQVINRVRKQVSDNLTNYLVYKVQTGKISHQWVAGLDYIQQTQPIGGGQSIARGYRKKDGNITTTYNPSDADNYVFENGLPVPNIPHFSLENPQYNVSYPHEYIFNVKQSYSPTKYYTFGAYLQGQLSIDRFKVLLALRQEFYRDVLNFKQPSEDKVKQEKLLPRLGLVYDITENINVYATYTESFQPQTSSILLNPELGGPFDPLSARMWEVGSKNELIQDRLSLNVALYRIEQNNILVNANDPSNPDLLQQRGQEVSKGIEIDVMGNILSNLSVTANYSYNDTRITESDNEEEIGRIKENAPFHQGGFWTKYTMNSGLLKGLGIGIGSNFVTNRVTFDTYTLGLKLPGYVVADAAVYYKVDRFNISVNFNNIFDKTHWTGGYSYTRLFPGAPRNYLLNVAYTF